VVAFFIMRTILYSIAFILCNVIGVFGQDSLLIGQKYFEDQIYAGVIFNILSNKPEALQQKGISTGLQIGFIKDIPLNKRGTTALGIGVGYGYNKYSQNLKIQPVGNANNSAEFNLLVDESDFRNKFETHTLEFPLEIRIYRSSSPTVYKFLRVYLGAKLTYAFNSRSYFTNADESVDLSPIPYINKWQYGPYIVVGWGTWNLYTYFDANSLFSSAPITDTVDPNDLRSIKIGLQFYIF